MRSYLERIVPKYFKQTIPGNGWGHGYESSVLYCGKYIFSYDECIGMLDKKGDGYVLYLNNFKYSKTTKELQNALRKFADEYVDAVYDCSKDDPIFRVNLATVPESQEY